MQIFVAKKINSGNIGEYGYDNDGRDGDGRKEDNDFRVIWNVPTHNCKKMFDVDLKIWKYGIEENNHGNG